MNEHETDGTAETVAVTTPEVTSTALEPAPTTKRKLPRPAPSRPTVVTIRNLTRRTVVAQDANGSGIHVFPGVEVEVSSDLIGPDILNKARRGLLAID